jgi:predicted ATPase/DNA-binding SARP family transcriptional activator
VDTGGYEEGTPPFSLRLFGPFQAGVRNQPLGQTFSRKGVWLLALLAVRHGRAVERSWLAGTLWPESEESQALSYLRRELSFLRKALGPEAARLRTPTGRTITLDLEGASVDVLTFDRLVGRGRPEDLEAAVALYGGPLLEGCAEEWVLPERVSREQAYFAALETLGTAAVARSEPLAAIRHLRRLVAADPLRESAYRALMEACAAHGDHAAAVETFRDLRAWLRSELNADPEAATYECFQRIRAEARDRASGRGLAAAVAASEQKPLRRASLPRPITRLIGRSAEMREITTALAGNRFVTLTGVGGVGKTRLAIQVALDAEDDYPAGATFVDLTAVEESASVPRAVIAALGVREEPGRPLVESLIEFTAERHLLLVLDNCEHVLSAAAQLAEALLLRSPMLRILATSRQSLGIAGERIWAVSPLPAPEPANLASSEKELPAILLGYDAVQLFVERAAQVQPEFRLTPDRCRTAGEICRRVDGIPLALELVAARLRGMSIEDLHARLVEGPGLLRAGSRTGAARQQTLQATMEWSWRLLSSTEQALMRQLSVFVGGWTLAAAEQTGWRALQEGGAPGDLQADGVLDLLLQLTDKSVVIFREEGGRPRYRMLEVVREYAWEQMDDAERRKAWRRHAEYFAALISAQPDASDAAEAGQALDLLEAEIGNVRRTLQYWIDQADAGKALHLGWVLHRFWQRRGYLAEGREWLSRALALPCDPDEFERAAALKIASTLALQQGDYTRAHDWARQSLEIFTRRGDRKNVISLLNDLGDVVARMGDLSLARTYFQQALDANRELGRDLCVAMNLGNLGYLAMDEGDDETASIHLEEGLAILRRLQDRPISAGFLAGLGTLAMRRGDLKSARQLCLEALEINREVGNRTWEAEALERLGEISMAEGALQDARTNLIESLLLHRSMGRRRGMVTALAALAGLEAAAGDPARAATLIGGVDAQQQALAAPMTPSEAGAHARCLASVSAALSPVDLERYRAEGAAMTPQQLVDYVLAARAPGGAGATPAREASPRAAPDYFAGRPHTSTSV